jgi:hypothetical protein
MLWTFRDRCGLIVKKRPRTLRSATAPDILKRRLDWFPADLGPDRLVFIDNMPGVLVAPQEASGSGPEPYCLYDNLPGRLRVTGTTASMLLDRPINRLVFQALAYVAGAGARTQPRRSW